MQDFKQLIVWQKSHQLVLDTYADSAKYLRHPDAWPVRDQKGPNLSMISFLRGILGSCPFRCSASGLARSKRFGACSPA